jgi:hypothetical protein
MDLLPPRVRQIVYAAFSVVAAGLTAAGAYFLATTAVEPVWVIGGLAALGSLGIVPNLVAAANVPKTQTVAPAAPVDVPTDSGTYDDGELAIPQDAPVDVAAPVDGAVE